MSEISRNEYCGCCWRDVMYTALLKADFLVNVCLWSYYLLQGMSRACCAIFSTKLLVWKIMNNWILIGGKCWLWGVSFVIYLFILVRNISSDLEISDLEIQPRTLKSSHCWETLIQRFWLTCCPQLPSNFPVRAVLFYISIKNVLA